MLELLTFTYNKVKGQKYQVIRHREPLQAVLYQHKGWFETGLEGLTHIRDIIVTTL